MLKEKGKREHIWEKKGYARNFLISKNKALFASKKNIKEVENIKKELSKNQSKEEKTSHNKN